MVIDITYATLIGSLMITAAIVITHSWLSEFNMWNKGHCPCCMTPWKHFDTDSQGGRGYTCGNGHYIWISYHKIDNNM